MEGEAVRRRVLNHYSGTCLINSGFSNENQKYSVVGSQETYSQSHPELFMFRRVVKQAEKDYKVLPSESLLNSINLLKNWDVGGAFYTTRQYSSYSSPLVTVRNYKNGPFTFNVSSPLFAGAMVVTTASSVWPARSSIAEMMLQLTTLGTEAIARTIPTVPEFSLANFLGELKNDGLPSLIGSVALRARSLPQLIKAGGHEYLNVEFGWKPLLSDIKNLCHSVMRSRELIQKYEERSGRMIGRRYDFPQVRSTSMTELGSAPPDPVMNSYLYSGSFYGRKVRVDTSVSDFWFEGRYRYDLPLVSDSRSKILLYAAEAEKLLGIQVTPEVLWNLAPWSWLSDWFFNVGSIMTNISALGKDNCVLNRGYIMGHTISESVYTNSGVNFVQFGPTGTISQTFRSEIKAREKATPWGFGVKFETLSPRQIAILASIGVSHDWHAGYKY